MEKNKDIEKENRDKRTNRMYSVKILIFCHQHKSQTKIIFDSVFEITKAKWPSRDCSSTRDFE